MHVPRVSQPEQRAADEGAAQLARTGDARALAAALQASRADTLATFAAVERALPGLRVPQRDTLNPPLWELGHIGWFQEWWLARNPLRAQGATADPDVARGKPRRDGADALYDSSRVPHATRWQLPLPDIAATHDDLAAQLDATLALLQGSDNSDDALYFFRLALHHEDMHHEAALYMAQGLALDVDKAGRWQPAALPPPRSPLLREATPWALGSAKPAGFAFDNELGRQAMTLPAGAIDAQVLRWADYLPFIEAGGYGQAAWWTPEGLAWLDASGLQAPVCLRRAGGRWQRRVYGRWQALDERQAACHLSAHEAQAWCRWAGRRLPTEAEWAHAAMTQPEDFRWGDVWEWTGSAFAPYPGFVPHPYRDYSAPWFDGRPVLRGASFMTQPRMRHLRYRNYFPPQRNDVAAGFRSCAV